MHIGDKRRSTWRLAGDSYRGVTRLIGIRDGREENKQTCEDRGGYGKTFHKPLFIGRDFQKRKRFDHLERGPCVQKNFDWAFLNGQKATRPELGWLERSDARAEQGERVTRSLFKNDSPALPKFDTITVSPIT